MCTDSGQRQLSASTGGRIGYIIDVVTNTQLTREAKKGGEGVARSFTATN